MCFIPARMRLSHRLFNIGEGLSPMLLDNRVLILPVFGTKGLCDPCDLPTGGSFSSVQDQPSYKGKSMALKFIASILTAAVLITGFNAAPARADVRELAKAAAGIAAVAIIANQLNKSRDNSKESVSSRNNSGQIYAPSYRAPQQQYLAPQRNHDAYQYIQPRPLPDRVSRKALPSACVQRVEDNRGRAFNVLGQRCLQNNFRGANALPQSCSVDVRTNRSWRTAYDANCLARSGYTIARH